MDKRRQHGRLLFALVLAGLASAARAEEPPRRVVSMNVCTDQLAMLLAGDGQLRSVSHVARDAGSSALAAEAGRYAVNRGQAEEVFLMRPDLVVAGTHTTPVAVAMLRRVGVRVEEFAPEASFEDVRRNIMRMGALLGREARAEELVAELDRGLSALRREAPERATVAVYSWNSYTSGPGTLAHAVVEASGLANLAERLGIAGVSPLPLETLLLAGPDLVVTGEARLRAPALAQENFAHPAFRALAGQARLVAMPDAYWVCGGPFTLQAARILQEAVREAKAVR